MFYSVNMINFNAGPSALPKEIKEQLIQEFHKPVSIFEVSHYSQEVSDIYSSLTNKIKKALGAPDEYIALFLPGGARLHMASILYNIGNRDLTPAYIPTGHWSKWAFDEAVRLGFTPVQTSSEQIDAECEQYRFLFYVDNETLNGSFFRYSRNAYNGPIIVDMTSSLLCEDVSFESTDVIIASCQKTLGLPGTCFILINPKHLFSFENAPRVLSYKLQEKLNSKVSTPSVLNFWLANKMLDWMEQVDLARLNHERKEKARKIYDLIDDSSIFYNLVPVQNRSTITITFHLKDQSLKDDFDYDCKRAGFIGMSGHKEYVPGYRLSLYPSVIASNIDEFLIFFKKWIINH